MSSLIVEVVKLAEIRPHPNADRLELATVKGWQLVVGKGEYHPGDMAVYCPIDSVLPDALAEAMNVKQYLGTGNRIRTAKLRGEYSQGLLVHLKYLDGKASTATEGTDVREALGVTKYEPPVRVSMGGEAETPDGRFEKYTDIEHYENFPAALLGGEDVAVTEKIHGTNFRVGKFDGRLLVGSRQMQWRDTGGNLYWRGCRLHDMDRILDDGDILYGEIYGQKVQSLAYGLKTIAVRFFDLRRMGRFVNYGEFAEFCAIHSLPIVPLLYRGPFSRETLELRSGQSTFEGAGHVREGVVIKPVIERLDPVLGRIVLKAINKDYLMKNVTDSH